MVAALSYNSKALWYLTRGFGLVALILLTLTMVLGLTQAVRFARPGWPRFVISALHKNASLLAVVVLAVHIVTAVADSYAPIRVVDVFIPFISKYRPVWTGLGALALDLMLALVVTSLLRERIGHRAWKGVHWAAYGCWPVAVVHGLGTGSDTKLGWVQGLYVLCVSSVLAALWWRLAKGWAIENAIRRGTAIFASVALPLAAGAWAVAGPLSAGWARKAGTPAYLLGSSDIGGRAIQLATPFRASFSGVQRETSPGRDGLVSVSIKGRFSGSQSGLLTVVLTGQPADGGGVDLTGSQVYLGSPAVPELLQGHVTELSGSSLVAALVDSRGRSFSATLRLDIVPGGDGVTGSLAVSS